MTVHAHPDDEASKGAPTVARYHAAGVETVLVCCTGGEQGDVLNPAMNRPEVVENLTQFRRDELMSAAAVIGYDHVEMLGYRDSGMPGTEANNDPRSFARAEQSEAVTRLVALIRRYRPDVMVIYGDEQELYPHPDHLRAHDVGLAAFLASGDGARYSAAGDPWKPAKLYYSLWSIAKLRLHHQTLIEMGEESPFPEMIAELGDDDHKITTRIDVTEFAHVRREALLAHASQIDPESKLWFGLPPEVEERMWNEDDYILAKSEVESSLPETDLFAGIE